MLSALPYKHLAKWNSVTKQLRVGYSSSLLVQDSVRLLTGGLLQYRISMLAVISWVCGLKLSGFLFSTALLENGIFLQIFKLFLSANSFFLSSAVQLCSSLAVQRSIGRILCTHLLHIYITRGCRAKKNHQQTFGYLFKFCI